MSDKKEKKEVKPSKPVPPQVSLAKANAKLWETPKQDKKGK